MKRRIFLLGTAAAAALATSRAPAQKVFRLGLFIPMPSQAGASYLALVREQLKAEGFVEGRNLIIDARFVAYESRPNIDVARELIALRPDAVLACSTLVTQALQAASATVPIVFAWVGDPVASGLVKDYAKPGTNATGVTNRFFELTAKRVELARELLPAAKRIAVISGVFDATLEVAMKHAEQAARRVSLELFRVATGMNWPDAIPAAARGGAHGAVVMTPFHIFGMGPSAERFVRSAAEHRMPAIYAESDTVTMGGLLSYSTNWKDDLRRAAGLAARIFRGEKTADLPVDQASRFELVLNLKTARELALPLPKPLLARADRVIGAT